MTKFKKWFHKEWNETRVLFRSIPGIVFTLFILSTVLMNLLASVAIVETSWLALDAGFLVSFVGFLLSDMIVKRFGPKAAIKTTILALLVNLVVCSIFGLVAVVANSVGAYFALADYATGVQWWIVGASAAAFLFSGVIDSILHAIIKGLFKKNPNGFVAHAASAWGSTFFGQLLDNLVFAFLFTFPASIIGLWGMNAMTVGALFGMALAGALFELLCQIIFTPIGFRVAESWRKNKIGQEYIDLIEVKPAEVKTSINEVEVMNENTDNRDE